MPSSSACTSPLDKTQVADARPGQLHLGERPPGATLPYFNLNRNSLGLICIQYLACEDEVSKRKDLHFYGGSRVVPWRTSPSLLVGIRAIRNAGWHRRERPPYKSKLIIRTLQAATTSAPIRPTTAGLNPTFLKAPKAVLSPIPAMETTIRNRPSQVRPPTPLAVK